MLRIGPAISSIALHIHTWINSPEAYRPACCPKCALKGLWGHGVYEREAGRGLGNLDPIQVPRYLCGRKGGCGSTCSVLPSCLPPRRWYLFSVQQAVLVLLLAGVSLYRCADIVGTLWGPARSTQRRWWLGLCARHAQFSFHLLTTHPEWGRTATWQEFWQLAFKYERLDSLMRSLDHAGVAVP